MKEQEKVKRFTREHNLDGETEFRILDLLAEAGEIAADAAKTAKYGQQKEEMSVKEDEIGDTLFSLLMLANDLDIDAGEALNKSIKKYEGRIKDKGDPGSK